jgi:hypothetical protein
LLLTANAKMYSNWLVLMIKNANVSVNKFKTIFLISLNVSNYIFFTSHITTFLDISLFIWNNIQECCAILAIMLWESSMETSHMLRFRTSVLSLAGAMLTSEAGEMASMIRPQAYQQERLGC